MRSSLLFVPASDFAKVKKASEYNCSLIIFDLEDSVSNDSKITSRNNLKLYLNNNTFNKEVCVRINDIHSPFYNDDLTMIKDCKCDFVVVPKATVQSVQNVLNIINSNHLTFNIIPLIETPLGLIEVDEICRMDNVKAIIFGSYDYCNDLGIQRTKTGIEILYARERIVNACKAYGIDAIDTPFNDFYDTQGLIDETTMIKKLGYDGKCCIHPSQIDIVNQVMYSDDDYNYAKRIILEYQKQEMPSVFVLDGKMIDKPLVEWAKKIIHKHNKR